MPQARAEQRMGLGNDEVGGVEPVPALGDGADGGDGRVVVRILGDGERSQMKASGPR